MESIKRNIYVLRNAIKEKIEVTKGTDMIPIELNVVDYNIPDYAIAVAYALGQTSDVPKKILCDVGNNAIKFTPSESFFEVGRNELMVRVLKDEKKLFTFCDTVICKDSTIKINDASEPQDPSLVEQLLNKMSDETKDRLVLQTEVEDIRKGYDETIYGSAGEAVRNQIDGARTDVLKIKDEMSKMKKNMSNFAEKSVVEKELEKKIDSSILGVSLPAIFTGQYLNSAPIYQKIIEIGGLPNNTDKTISTGIDNADYIWIDQSNSFAFNAGASYPIPYKDPRVSTIGISARIINKGKSIVVSTGNDWNGYSGIVTVKYTMR